MAATLSAPNLADAKELARAFVLHAVADMDVEGILDELYSDPDFNSCGQAQTVALAQQVLALLRTAQVTVKWTP